MYTSLKKIQWELKWLNVMKYVKHQNDDKYKSSDAASQKFL